MLRPSASTPNPNTNYHLDPNTDPNTDSTPNPNPDPNTNYHPNPNTNQLADHRVFTIYRPSITFTSDSGSTDILVTQRDASILTDYTPFDQTSDRPGLTRIFQTIYSVSPHLSTLATPLPTLALDSPSTIHQITQLSTAPNNLTTMFGNSHFPNPAPDPPASSFATNKMLN